MQAIAYALSIFSLMLTGASVYAQKYPNGPVNMVIPLAPGDSSDVAGRAIGEELSKLLKTPVVTLNRPGAGGTPGTDSVAKAKKDGYTLVFTNNAALVSNRILTPNAVAYDPLRDFAPIGLATRFPLILAVRQEEPYKNFAEMVEYSKKNPGKLRIATVGAGSVGHFTVEVINSLTGAGLTMVPFKGASPGVAAILGGHVEGGALAFGMVGGHMKGGAMRGIVASIKVPGHPEIPTLIELGYPQNLIGVWTALLAPVGVPTNVINVLVPALEKTVQNPALTKKLAPVGIIPDYAPPDKLIAEIRQEHKSVEEIAKNAGLIK
jgi:tripartite-type tricarboxylate transporter receptor subunit TctC